MSISVQLGFPFYIHSVVYGSPKTVFISIETKNHSDPQLE